MKKKISVAAEEKAFRHIMSGEVSDDEIIKFLLDLKNKGETVQDIIGALNVMLPHIKPAEAPENAIDVCGTGGDGLHTLNISTAVAFVLAGAGVPVAKHGGRAVSSNSGSADVLTELGINISADANKQFKKANMAFLFAPDYHPIMKVVSSARAKLKTKTIFNLLGPLLNPANAKYQLIGVYDARYLQIFAQVLQLFGTKKAWIVCGADGLDELSISGESYVVELDGTHISPVEIITPEDARLPRHSLETIKGGDAAHNAAAIIKLLNGEKGAYRDIVLLNAAAALVVAGKAGNLLEGKQLAEKSIDSGQARKVLDKLQELTK